MDGNVVMPSNILDLVWDEMQKIAKKSNTNVTQLHNATEQAQFVDGIPAYTFANLPTLGLANGTTYVTLAFVSNGRKAAEGAGLGTGQLCYWNAPTSQWLRVRDDSVITV